MKTYTKRVSENTVLIGGIDRLGVKGDLLEVTQDGENLFRVYHHCESNGEFSPIKTYSNEMFAIEACRKEIRSFRMLISELDMRRVDLRLQNE